MTTNLAEVNARNIEKALNTIYRVSDVILSRSDGGSIVSVRDMSTLVEYNSVVKDIVEAKVKAFVSK